MARTVTDIRVNNLPRLYTDQQVAERLGVSRWTIRNLHRCGRLRGISIARKLRFRAEAVESYLSELESGT